MKVNITNKKMKISTIINVMLIILILLNFIMSSGTKVEASSTMPENITSEEETVDNESEQIEEDNNEEGEAGFWETALDGIVGLLLYPIKLIPLLIGSVLSLLMNLASGENITIFNVLFNKIGLTGINFFEEATGPNASTVNAIRSNVAIWYVSIRNLAAIILAIILIYVAIRMAISTVAEDKAKYKNMLIDWLTSLCLLFVLHYVMIIVININNNLVELLTPDSSSVIDLDSVQSELAANAMGLGFAKGVGNAIAYMMLVGMSFIYFFAYVKRMITLAFLIIISPLITVTYSIDKMGDGKSQALNTWLKEFIYNILIQPFQCIIYLSLVSTVLRLITVGNVNLIEVFLAIYVLIFMYQAEEIVKNIFGFKSQSMGQTIASAAITGALISRGTSLFKGGDKKKKKTQSEYKRRPQTKDSQSGRTSEIGETNQGTVPPQPASGGANSSQSESIPNEANQENNSNIPNITVTPNSSQNRSSSSSSTRSNKNNKYNKIIKGAKKVGKFYLKAGMLAAGAGLGLSTGKLETGIAGLTLGSTVSGRIDKSIKKKESKREEDVRNCTIANDIDNYQDRHGLTNTQVIQRTQDWLDGISMPDRDDDEGLALYQHLTQERKIQEDEGRGEEEIRERIDKLIQDSLSGDQSRVPKETLTEKIRNRFTN